VKSAPGAASKMAWSAGSLQSAEQNPETMSHASMSPQARKAAWIGPGTIRVSAGIENTQDLLDDMARAFGALARQLK